MSAHPKPLPGIERDAWRKMSLAKQRLAASGPLIPGRDAFMRVVNVVAGELRLQGVDEETAAAACQQIPFEPNSASRRRMLRDVPDFVQWAYTREPPLLTGCPRAAKHSGNPTTQGWREVFAGYCDDACARTCRIRKAVSVPGLALIDSPFEPVWNSTLWLRGAGLGPAGRDVYELLAGLAAAHADDPEAPVWASSRYQAAKLGYIIGQSNVRLLLAKMASLGLVTRTDDKRGFYRVHVLTPEKVAELEAFLGTAEKVAERELDTKRDWLSYREYLGEWDNADEL